jgi:hypothetical protein
MKSEAPLRKPRVEPQSTDAQTTKASNDDQWLERETLDQESLGQELGQEQELREAILDDLEVDDEGDDWDVETKSLPEWRREALFTSEEFTGEQDDILVENTVSDYTARRFGKDADDGDGDGVSDRVTREYEGEEALREAILNDLAGEEWEAETKPFSRLPREEDDGGSISPEELGEQFLRGAVQQERRVKLDDTEPRLNVDVLQDAVEQASLFDRNHDPDASEILPLVDADETAADAAHRIHHAAAPEVAPRLAEARDSESPADSAPADSERRASRTKDGRDRATTAPPSHQRRVSADQGQRKVAR